MGELKPAKTIVASQSSQTGALGGGAVDSGIPDRLVGFEFKRSPFCLRHIY